MTYKSKLVRNFMKNGKRFFNRMQSSDEPMRELGPGISSYHQLLLLLTLLFVVLSLLHIPVLSWFADGNYFGEGHWIMHGMLANLGYSKTECVSSSMILGATLNLKCNAGSMQLVDWGVVTH